MQYGEVGCTYRGVHPAGTRPGTRTKSPGVLSGRLDKIHWRVAKPHISKELRTKDFFLTKVKKRADLIQ